MQDNAKDLDSDAHDVGTENLKTRDIHKAIETCRATIPVVKCSKSQKSFDLG